MNALEALHSDDFQMKASCFSTAEALRSFFSKQDEVVDLRRAINSGEVTKTEIEEHVRSLLGEFRQGERFAHEAILAAIAVALESYPDAFAKDYLYSLAKLKIAEVPFATRVARICLQARNEKVMGTTYKAHIVHVEAPDQSMRPREFAPAWMVHATMSRDCVNLAEAS